MQVEADHRTSSRLNETSGVAQLEYTELLIET